MVAEIQGKIIKQGKRNVLSRLAHAKSDKEAIAAWRSDLNRMLLMFNVRSVVSVRLLLTINSQTELAINTHVTVSDIHRGVANTHTLVSDVHHGVLNTHAIVSDIHRNILKSQEGTDTKHQMVGGTRVLRHHRTNIYHRPDSK